MAAKAALAAVEALPQETPDPAPTHPAPHVFVAMAAVQAEIARKGIDKTKKEGSGVKYAFRGIDEVMNALAPILSEHRLLIVPQILSRDCVERKTQGGSAMYVVTVEAEFSLVSGVDGSTFKGRTIGEAQDMGDKATNKAMSIAYKYFCFQTFCIPLDAADDPDAHPAEKMAPRSQQSAPSRAANDFPGDRQTTSQKAAPAKQPDKRAIEAADKKVDELKERAAKARIALQRAGDELGSAAGVRAVWDRKCDKIREDLEAAGMKGELARLVDYYQQVLSGFGRDEFGHPREGEDLEAAI